MDEITTDAYGEGEQFRAFRRAFEDSVTLRRQRPTLRDSKVRRAEHVVADADVTMPPASESPRYLTAY
jgi:hypothetical protein